MVPILLMVIGVLLLIVAAIGLVAYFLAPFYKTIRVVLYGEDDYLHFTSPENYKFLQTEKRKYLRHIAVVGITGLIMFGSGFYLRFGSRGLKMMFALNSESPSEGHPSGIEGIDRFGDYTDPETDKTYKCYFVVEGDRVFYRNERVGSVSDLSEYLDGHAGELKGIVCVVDHYATSAAYYETMNILHEKGYDYELATA